MLAASSILAALLRRERTGRGARVDQPLITGSLPFVTWRWAEAAVGREQVVDLLLGGACPCYRTYRCGGGELMAVSALEPKFWLGFVTHARTRGASRRRFRHGRRGRRGGRSCRRSARGEGRDHWLALAEEHGLPLSAVHTTGEATEDPIFADAGLTRRAVAAGRGDDRDRPMAARDRPDTGETRTRPRRTHPGGSRRVVISDGG